MQRTSVHTKYFELCKKRVMSDLHNMCICSTYYVLPSTIYFIIVMGNGAVTSRLLGSRRERKIGILRGGKFDFKSQKGKKIYKKGGNQKCMKLQKR